MAVKLIIRVMTLQITPISLRKPEPDLNLAQRLTIDFLYVGRQKNGACLQKAGFRGDVEGIVMELVAGERSFKE